MSNFSDGECSDAENDVISYLISIPAQENSDKDEDLMKQDEDIVDDSTSEVQSWDRKKHDIFRKGKRRMLQRMHSKQ